jgi:hypothetical protein
MDLPESCRMHWKGRGNSSKKNYSPSPDVRTTLHPKMLFHPSGNTQILCSVIIPDTARNTMQRNNMVQEEVQNSV